MSNNNLFNSKTEPIPHIRPDLDIIQVQNNGDSYLYFHDMHGYATPDFVLDQSAQTVLALFDGQKSISDLKSYLGNGTTTDQLLEYVQFLDKNRLLHSPNFKAHANRVELDYEQSAIHHSITAGGSYPADPEELKNFLDDAFLKYGVDNQKKSRRFNSINNKSSTSFVVPPYCAQTDVILSAAERSRNMIRPVKALYAPHIDPRVGMKTYVETFETLKSVKPKKVVILATSHYAGLYPEVYQNKPFVISNKDFEMPMGTVPADGEAIARLLENSEETGLSDQDRAHRIEHSIELHLLFLQYIWEHDFSIIPIVVGGFDEIFYMDGSHLKHQIKNFSKQLYKQFGEEDETLFLISGDLAHVGKKFGDDHPAASIKKEVRQFDEQFLAAGQDNASNNMLRLMKQNYDPHRICGFPPLYTFLKAFPDLKGQTISYDHWNETERESAVTFGSILY